MPTSTETGNQASTHHRASSEFALLLDAARTDLYRKNAFRVTGLPVDATTREIARHAAKLKLLSELGQNPQSNAVFPLDSPPTPEDIGEAHRRLKDPARRLIEEFFWFWPEEFGNAQSDPAIQALEKGDSKTAIGLWQAKENQSVSGIVAKHNLTLICHLCALDWEIYAVRNDMTPVQQNEAAEYWRGSIRRWEDLVPNDYLWEKVASRIRQLNDPHLPTGFARRLRTTLPQALDKIHAELALELAQSGKLERARTQIRFMRETNQGLDDVATTAELVLAPTKKRIHEFIEGAKQEREEDPARAFEAARLLLEHARPVLYLFNLFFGENEHAQKEVFDEAATTALSCLIAYHKSTDDDKTCVPLLEQALALAAAAEVRSRIQENLETARGNFSHKQIAPIRALCESGSKAAEENPASADQQAQCILREATSTLERLSTTGVSASVIADAKDQVALVVLHCAVLFGNKTERWARCIPILEQCLTLAVAPEVKARILEQLETVKKNNLLYGNVKPISSAPALGTLNGVGLTLYGSSDRESTTGSYLTTYYFVVFFVPILPLCRYRVTKNGDSYRFFGKAPLRLIDKWHIGIVLSLILFVAIPAILVNEPTRPAVQPAPAPAQPPPTATAPSIDFTPDAALERRAPLQGVFRTPDERRTLLNEQKAEIEQERTRLNVLDLQIKNMSREIERDRILLDRESQFEIEAYNAKIGTYNTLVEESKTATMVFNENVRNYNAKLGLSQH